MTRADLVVAGALVLPGGAVFRGEIGVRDGRIVALADSGSLEGDERIDVPLSAVVLPGAVDCHVHTRSEPEEGVTRATTAAASGGVTTIVDMPYDDPEPVATVAALERKAADVEREALVDVALWATIPKNADLDEVPGLVAAGAAGFKVSTFETDPTRFPRVADGDLLLAMRRIREIGSLIAFHAENDDIVKRLSRLLDEESRFDPLAHAAARPSVAETEAIGRVLELALATGARTHIAHVSVERGFVLVARARADGADVTAETCTHYLLLDERELERQGPRAKINPPLRQVGEVEALWRLLAAGEIDLVTSDHVGWATHRKPEGNIFDAKSGVPGLELTVPLLWTEGRRRSLPYGRLLAVLCENPARRLGLWPRKGAITVGADADLIIFDLESRWRVAADTLATAAGWSPYEGREVEGRIRSVLVRGRVVVEDGSVVGAPGVGMVVRPGEPT